MSGLFKLPPEIRQRIYEEILVVGKVFPYTLSESYNENDCDYDASLTPRERGGYEAPTIALLLVCKAIHSEAEPVLYRQNKFVLPAFGLTARFFNRSLHNDTRREWVKSVQVGFVAWDLTKADREATLDEQLRLTRDKMLFPDGNYVWPHAGVKNWDQNMHEAYKVCLSSVVWPRKASFILEHLQLHELAIRFDDAKCIKDCCCMRKDAIKAMARGFAMGPPKILKLGSLGDATETAGKIIRLWTSMRLSPSPFDVKVEEEKEVTSLLDVVDFQLDRYFSD